MPNNRATQVFTVVLLALAAALAGCAAPATSDLSITDRGTFVPSARVSIDIAPRAQPPSQPHSTHGIEFGLSGGSGDDTQSLAAGEQPVVFGGQTFTAPNRLAHEFDFRFVELAYRYRIFFGDGSFGIEALGGLAYAELDLSVASATQRASESLGSGGIVGGFGIVWRLRPSTSLQSRITFFVSAEREDVTAATRFDAYVAQALGRHAGLRLGLAAWNVGSRRQDDDGFSSSVNSPIRLRFAGPALGFELMF